MEKLNNLICFYSFFKFYNMSSDNTEIEPKKRGRKKQEKASFPNLTLEVDTSILKKYNEELKFVGINTIKEVLKILNVKKFSEKEAEMVQKLDGILDVK